MAKMPLQGIVQYVLHDRSRDCSRIGQPCVQLCRNTMLARNILPKCRCPAAYVIVGLQTVTQSRLRKTVTKQSQKAFSAARSHLSLAYSIC